MKCVCLLKSMAIREHMYVYVYIYMFENFSKGLHIYVCSMYIEHNIQIIYIYIVGVVHMCMCVYVCT